MLRNCGQLAHMIVFNLLSNPAKTSYMVGTIIDIHFTKKPVGAIVCVRIHSSYGSAVCMMTTKKARRLLKRDRSFGAACRDLTLLLSSSLLR